MADEIIKLIEYLKNDPFVQGFFVVGSVLGVISILFFAFLFVKIFKDIFRRK